MIEDAIFTRLSEFTDLTDLTGTRITPQYAPKNPTDPYVVYQRINTNYMSNQGGESSGVAMTTFQINSWSKNPDTARAVAKQIRLALQGYGPIDVGGEHISAVYLTNDAEDVEPVVDGEDKPWVNARADFDVWHDV